MKITFSLVCAVCLLCLTTIAGCAAPVPGTLNIRWIDVEGGGATLIITPAGESVLIDVGNPGARDAGRIFKAATDAGLKRIDYFLLTHFHTDHYGGAADLAKLIPIGHIYDKGIPSGEPDGGRNAARWQQQIQPYRDIPAVHRLLLPGDFLPLKQAAGTLPLTLRCLGANRQFIPPPAGAPRNPLTEQVVQHAPDNSDNSNSAVFLLDFGPFRFFDGGDLTWNIEASLVTPVNRVGQVDVYQVNHHGLDQSNNTVLIHSLAPTVSVMNNAARKGTARSTIEGLKSSPGIVDMYQMHKNLRADIENNTADEFIANLADDPTAETANEIHLTVEPDGKSYSVLLPATGHTKRYSTREK